MYPPRLQPEGTAIASPRRPYRPSYSCAHRINSVVHAFSGYTAQAQNFTMIDTRAVGVKPSRKAGGAATLLASALSNQLGAATASFAFPVMGPVGAVAVRQLMAAAVLLPILRPRVGGLGLGGRWAGLFLA